MNYVHPKLLGGLEEKALGWASRMILNKPMHKWLTEEIATSVTIRK